MKLIERLGGPISVPISSAIESAWPGGVGGWTQEALEVEERAYSDLDAATLQAWYPAAHSVGILFSPEPDDDEISLITARAMKFLTERGVALEGLRLLKVEVITTQVKTIPLEGL